MEKKSTTQTHVIKYCQIKNSKISLLFSVLYFSVILINNKSWKIHPSVHQLTGNDVVAPAISTTMLNHSVDPNSIMFRRSLFN